MKISMYMVIGFLVLGLIILSNSAQAGWFGPKGEDCVGEINPETHCDSAFGGSVELKRSDNSAVKVCEDVDYKSKCSMTKRTIGEKRLFSPSRDCDGEIINTYNWEVDSCG